MKWQITDMFKYLALFFGILILVLFVALFAFRVVRETPEQLVVSQENERLRLLNRQQELVNKRQQQAIKYYIQQQELENAKNIEQHRVIFYAKLTQKLLIELWPLFILAALILTAFSCRKYFEAKETFTDGVLTTRVASKEIPGFIQKAYEARIAETTSFKIEQLKPIVEFMKAVRPILEQTAFPTQPIPEIQEAQILPELPAYTQSITHTQLITHPDLESNAFPIGITKETDGLCQAIPEEAVSFLVTAKPGQGKSHIVKNIILGLFHLLQTGKDLEFYFFDPHWNAPDGLSTFFKPILSHPAFIKKILGKKAIEQGIATKVLQQLHDDATQRQEDGIITPLRVIIVDELRLFCQDKQYGKANYELCVELLNDRKFGYFCIYITQDFTGKEIGGTGISGLGVSSIVAKSKQSKARILLEEDAKKAEGLQKGEAAVAIAGHDETVICQIPMITESDLTPFLHTQGHEIDSGKNISQPVTQHTVTEKCDIPHTPDITGNLPHFSDLELWQNISEKLKNKQLTVSQLARELHFDRTYLSKWLNQDPKAPMTDTLRNKLHLYLGKKNKVIPLFNRESFKIAEAALRKN